MWEIIEIIIEYLSKILAVLLTIASAVCGIIGIILFIKNFL